MKYKIYIIFSIIIVLGTMAVYFVAQGYYPIAIVNNGFITAKEFEDNYAMASVYYGNILKSYGLMNPTSSFQYGLGQLGQASLSPSVNNSSTPDILTQSEIQQAVLASLVENILIDYGARKEVGNDLNRLVNEKVSRAANVPEMEKAVRALYSSSLDNFKREVLAPQAKWDILAGGLFLKGQKIEDWLSSAKKSSRVIIFSGKFYWDGEDVKSK